MLGSNVPMVGGVTTGFKTGDQWECECIQIYLTPSRTWSVPPLTEEKINEFKHAWSTSSIKCVVAHIPFLVNLASPDRELWKKSAKRLITEITIANKLNVPYLVLHPGSYRNSRKQDGFKRLIKGLNLVAERIKEPKAVVLLETMSGQGTMLGSSFKEINHILRNLHKNHLFGVCLDTAHIFHAGYNIIGYKRYNEVISEFDDVIGLDKLKAIHLNDSKTELGSRVDRHACIGEGKIGLQFFHALLKDERFFTVPKILEIPERDDKSEKSLKFLRNLQNAKKVKSIPLQVSIDKFTR